ncbi:STAS domain-containing protein [Streptomyces sp. NPDC060031]|uniref:STAS domain-containing protein n=1 Tax=Streptomyces sp. NPDC060031 TaxID=3347043 RepID=UPI00369915EE
MSRDPEGTVITVAGELDMGTCPTLHRATAAAAANGAPLHLDLIGVPFMDVVALNLLLDLQRDFQRRQAALTISGFQRQPARLLTLTSSEHLLRSTPPRDVIFRSASSPSHYDASAVGMPGDRGRPGPRAATAPHARERGAR